MNTNVNFAWTGVFVKRLEKLGVRDVCVSPGSRNTPLTLAFAESKKIKSHVFVDERASAFFALGAAKRSGSPVVMVTTSGTATAELYPAIVEAYQTCVPLIVCTADRPAYLRGTGANQTVNQENLYKNHICKFYDARLPKLTEARLSRLIKITDDAFSVAATQGPVHINFPFEKPLEPETFNAEFDFRIAERIVSSKIRKTERKEKNVPESVLKKIGRSEKPLILLGGNVSEKATAAILKLANKLDAPVIADGTSSARYAKGNKLVISYGATIFKSELENFSPDLILSFGKAPTTNSVLDFYARSNAYKISINSKGRIHDPSRTHNVFVRKDEIAFAKSVAESLAKKRKSEFAENFLLAEKTLDEFAQAFTAKTDFRFEGKVARSLIEILPDKANLFIGNSTLPRDVDFFSGKNGKRLKIYSSRGASGIDGIISAAAGVASKSKEKTFLYVGDLSFFYDLTFLYYLKEYEIPLTVILQNNRGGGIFRMLPIAQRKKDFDKFFNAAVNVDFSEIVRAFGVPYFSAENETELSETMENKGESGPAVIEIGTDSVYSAETRKLFFNEAIKALRKQFSRNAKKS